MLVRVVCVCGLGLLSVGLAMCLIGLYSYVELRIQGLSALMSQTQTEEQIGPPPALPSRLRFESAA